MRCRSLVMLMVITFRRRPDDLWLLPWRRAEELSAGLFSWPMIGKSTSDIHPKLSATQETTCDITKAESTYSGRRPLLRIPQHLPALTTKINNKIHLSSCNWKQVKVKSWTIYGFTEPLQPQYWTPTYTTATITTQGLLRHYPSHDTGCSSVTKTRVCSSEQKHVLDIYPAFKHEFLVFLHPELSINRFIYMLSSCSGFLTLARAVLSSRGCIHRVSSGSAVLFHVRPFRYDRP